ncbi:MAG: NAD(P)/FAD-dependent oxidoreductase [Flaviaesturariibacter sp.]|nr:NAD(P)/FAD-dependent oxidoreductase [Flaviaesturariibacter sp.]
MQNTGQSYDVAIVGGGLAGLACAIQLATKGYQVILFEKEAYPYHKVCGEYISLESWDFLKSLGLHLDEMSLPIIHELQLTAPNGNSFTTKLPLGGFGVSRYLLDSSLAAIAKQKGVLLLEKTKVEEIDFDDGFRIRYNADGQEQIVCAKLCCLAYGKRSNLDVKWTRSFLTRQDKRLKNFVGIKYHLQADWPNDMIGLHNFKDGYCGISKIEADRYCLCYMTKADNLKACGNDIQRLQDKVLSRNPHLEKLFSEGVVLEGFPVVISQINFQPKTQVENHCLMLGDAAGMITPLCGNGMSIALHTSKIAANLAALFLSKEMDRATLERTYTRLWKQHFAKRLQTGRMLQRFFGSTHLSNAFVWLFKAFPTLAKPIIRMTHGDPF